MLTEQQHSEIFRPSADIDRRLKAAELKKRLLESYCLDAVALAEAIEKLSQPR